MLNHHLRFLPIINKMSHKKRPKQEPNSNSSSPRRRSSRVSSHSTAAAAAPPGFFVQPASLETPKPTSSRPKKVKVEEDGLSSEKGKRVIAEQSAPPPESQSPPVRSAGGVTRTRIFTDADEIMILQGMIEYAKSKNVSLPLANLWGFYSFLRGKLSADVTNSQLYDKIKRLKNRYLNRLEKKPGVNNHDLLVNMLCKSIWADVERAVVDDDDAHGPDEMEGEDDKEAFSSKYPLLMESLDWDNSSSFSKLDSVKQNIHRIGSDNATELELKWMKLQSKESQIRSKKKNFKTELITLVLNAMNGEGEPSSAAAGAGAM